VTKTEIEYELPSRQEALKLLIESGCAKNVIEHCKAVAKIALKIARKLKSKGFNVDLKLVEVGALLHDIGRSKTHTVHHAIVGAKIAKEEGLPEPVIKIIERHVGGGITAEEARRLGWPVKDYTPQTLEEKIVCYADKLVEGNKQVPIEVTMRKLADELGADHPAIERIKRLDEEFASMVDD